uniref:Uncharacterized protein n=1 Tax=Anguilla anguilla TaxID=7936 RepID=A0A0E9X0K6_ANGAN
MPRRDFMQSKQRVTARIVIISRPEKKRRKCSILPTVSVIFVLMCLDPVQRDYVHRLQFSNTMKRQMKFLIESVFF